MAGSAEDGEAVGDVRSFNRFYTRLIGMLEEGVVETAYSLPAARVLFELAPSEEREVGDVRAALGVDAGYLSRMLTRLEQQGLVTRRRSELDARRQVAALTEAGRAEFALLDRRAAAQVAGLLDRLGDSEQRRLSAAMGEIRELLDGSRRAAAPVLRTFGPGDLGWVVARSGELYAEEYGWNSCVETRAAKELAEYAERDDPARERGWIAEVDGRRAGSVLCMRREEGVAQLRMLLVDPDARGLGIGGLLVDECMRFAREVGYREMVLWTTSVLTAARRIYLRAGFGLVSQEPFDGFGPGLTAELWRCTLSCPESGH